MTKLVTLLPVPMLTWWCFVAITAPSPFIRAPAIVSAVLVAYFLGAIHRAGSEPDGYE